MHEKLSDGEHHAVLYRDINNLNKLLEYNKANPDRNLQSTDYTLMSKMAPFTTKRLTEWFVANRQDFSLKLESKLTYEDVRDHNIIFIGQYKTMNLSMSFFLKNSKTFSTFGDGFRYSGESVTEDYNSHFGKSGYIEYAMVSYTSISPGKSAMYFVSNNDFGTMAVVNHFTTPAFLKEFYRQLPSGSCSFNALFKVEGIERVDISCELVKLEVIDSGETVSN